jgi:hypothetical protein
MHVEAAGDAAGSLAKPPAVRPAGVTADRTDRTVNEPFGPGFGAQIEPSRSLDGAGTVDEPDEYTDTEGETHQDDDGERELTASHRWIRPPIHDNEEYGSDRQHEEKGPEDR